MGRVYEVTGTKTHDGVSLYAFRGVPGWFNSEYFEEAHPYLAIANEGPVVNRKMTCYCFVVAKGDERNFNGWAMERVVTDVVRSFFRCGYNTFIVFTDEQVYIVQTK
jgi:hypothetical protein